MGWLGAYVIATGRSVSLEYFVERSFDHFGLDWKNHIQINNGLLRPSDISFGAADPSHALESLGWKAELSVEDVIQAMCAA
jgi:GDPmannose 4,6-dehydratase